MGMITSRAVLIQDVREFLVLLDEVLCGYPSMANPTIKKAFLEWVIAKEISNCYLLYDNVTLGKINRFASVYYSLTARLNASFSEVFAHYIKVPKIYGEANEISVRLTGTSLYIDYFHTFKEFKRPLKWIKP